MNLNTLNPSGVDAVIVDLDGTMVDTMGDFNEALNRMLRDLSLPAIAADQVESMVGKGSEHLLRSVLKHVLAPVEQAQAAIKIEALFPQAWARYQHHYLEINGSHSAVYPGVVQGLQALEGAGLPLACLTNKPLAFAHPLLQAKGLDGFFARVFGGDSFERRQPGVGVGVGGVCHVDDVLLVQLVCRPMFADDAICGYTRMVPINEVRTVSGLCARSHSVDDVTSSTVGQSLWRA